MPCLFLLSYARENYDAYLQEFYTDLVREVGQLVVIQGNVGFRDDESMPLGTQWRPNLAQALQTCQIFVALCSPAYFSRGWCGKEWGYFQSRLQDNTDQGSPTPPLLIPVLWIPTANAPAVLGDLQYTHFGITPAEYGSYGLRILMKIKHPVYEQFLVGITQTIVQASAQYKLPPATRPPVLDQIPDAFRAPARSSQNNIAVTQNKRTDQIPNPEHLGPRYVQIFYIVGQQSELSGELRDKRMLLDPYPRGDQDPLDWKPYFPPSAEQVTILTQEAATIERLTCTHLPFDDRGLIETLEQFEKENRIVLFIVDVWTLRLSRYRDVMSRFDQRMFRNCVLLITWNEDDESKAQQQELEEAVWLTLGRHRQSGQGFHYPIKSGEKFKEELVAALHESRNNIIQFSDVMRKLDGGGPPTIPTITGPGGTT